MKKILLFIAIFLCYSLHSQVQVGFGNNTSQSLPFNPYYLYSYSQSIYLPSEINASGTIKSLQWYFSGTSDLANSNQLTVYLGTTTKNVFTSTADWEPSSNLTMVYSGILTTDLQPGWVTIPISDFVYNGTSNLVVAVKESKPGSDGFDEKFYNSAVTGKRSIYKNSNTTDFDATNPPAASNTIAYVPNVIFGNLKQDCVTPINLQVNSVGTTTASVSWTTSGTAPLGGSDYYYSTSNVPPTALTEPLGNVPSGTSANLQGLISGSTYYVWVRSNCTNDVYSSWSLSATFVTVCDPKTTFSENFDSVTPPQLPICWSKIVRGPNVVPNGTVVQTWSDLAISSSPNSVKMFNSSANLATNDIILVTPQLSNLNSGLYRLKFYAKGSIANYIQVGTLNSNASDAVFTPILGYESVYISTKVTEYTVNIPNYSGSDTYLGIRMGSPDAASSSFYYSTILLDDIRWDLTPACNDVYDVIVPEVTGETAQVNWTAGGNQGQSYQVAYGPADTATDPNVLTILDASVTQKIITELSPKTAYKVWVRSVCHVGGNGVWIGPQTFTTDCPSLATLNENFDGYTVPSQQLCCNQLPDCWSKIIRSASDPINPTYVYVHTSSHTFSHIGSLPNAIEMTNSGNSTDTTDIILVTPPLSTLGLGTYRLKFIAQQNVAIKTAGVTVGTLNAPNDLGVFTPIAIVDIATTPKEYIVSFSGYTTTDRYIGIKMSSKDIGGLLLHLDDVRWEFEPLCSDVTDIFIPQTKTDGATVNWTDNDTEHTDWQIVVGSATETNPDALIPENTKDTSFNIIGKASNTTYKVWVRSNCVGVGLGAWIGPVSFTTTCQGVSTLNENFDGTVSGKLPNCWSQIIRGTQLNGFSEIFVKGYDKSYSAPNSAYLYKSDYLADTELILVSPNLNNIFSGNNRLVFYAMRNPNGNPATIKVGTLNGNIKYSEFNAVTEDITLGNSMTKYVINFNATTGIDSFIGFKISNADAGSVYIDNVKWERQPTCPDPINFYVKLTRGTSATFEWDPADGVESWDVATSSSEIDPDKLEYVNTTIPSVSIGNLTPDTNYLVWIRSVCASGKGDWVGAYMYKTDCEMIQETLNENLESTAVSQLPMCWRKVLRGLTLDPVATIETVASNAHSGVKSIMMRSNQSKEFDDIILVSPSLSTLSSGTHTLKFWALSGTSLQVGTMSNNNSYGDMNLLQIFAAPTNYAYTQYTVPFTSYTGTDTYIGIRLVLKNGSQIVYIDDITFDNGLSTDDFVISELNYYPNPVTDVLTISHINNIKAVAVYNMLGQQVMTNSIDGNLAKIDMSALSNGTYMVKVLFDNSFENIKVLKL